MPKCSKRHFFCYFSLCVDCAVLGEWWLRWKSEKIGKNTKVPNTRKKRRKRQKNGKVKEMFSFPFHTIWNECHLFFFIIHHNVYYTLFPFLIFYLWLALFVRLVWSNKCLWYTLLDYIMLLSFDFDKLKNYSKNYNFPYFMVFFSVYFGHHSSLV